MKDARSFFGEFLKKPARIGALVPSSRSLAEQMISGIDFDQARVIVEYGAGTGPFTEIILERKPAGSHFLSIEQSPKLAGILYQRFPDLDLHQGSVEDLPDLLEKRGLDEVDCVISGLPWASFGLGLQDRLLTVTTHCLRSGGHLATFAYLQGLLMPAGMAFRSQLKQRFAEVRRSPVVWRNLPPAFVYRAVAR